MQYGKIEARIKLPRGQGVWPAFWMLGKDIPPAGWPESGEIDIMENVGKEPSIVHGTVHGPGYSGAKAITAAHTIDIADRFHVYAVEWSAHSIEFLVDGKSYATRHPRLSPRRRNMGVRQPFFLLFEPGHRRRLARPLRTPKPASPNRC